MFPFPFELLNGQDSGTVCILDSVIEGLFLLVVCFRNKVAGNENRSMNFEKN